MISQLKEFFKLKNLLGSSVIPLLAFLTLGYIQRNVYDWTQLKNRGYERGIEIGGFLLVYFILYVLAIPFFWFRPQLTTKLYKAGSAQAQPETSQVFDLADRQRMADVTIELEFTPTFLIRKCIERMNKKELGIKLTWLPRNLFACNSRLKGDKDFCEIRDSGILLFPFEKMDIDNPKGSFIKYSFRFALGTTEVVQHTTLCPKHLNWKSRLLFGLSNSSEFLFEIKDSRAKDVDTAPSDEANALEGSATLLLDPAPAAQDMGSSAPNSVPVSGISTGQTKKAEE